MKNILGFTVAFVISLLAYVVLFRKFRDECIP